MRQTKSNEGIGMTSQFSAATALTPTMPVPATAPEAPGAAAPGGLAEVRRLFEPSADEVPVGMGEGAPALEPWAEDPAETDPDIPPAEPWAHRFAQAVVEAIGGVRPVTQLVRWTSRTVYRDLERRVRVLSEARHGGRVSSLVRPQVSSIRVCHPVAEVAEVAVTVRHGRRVRALAARLEFRRGVWCCTALEVG